MKLILIRHGKTYGNLMKRYIGKTDEPLINDIIPKKKYPDADTVVSSSLKRCIMTARLIYPDKMAEVFEGLAEIDFGEFENKSYEELKDNKYYNDWINSGGVLPFPGGESRSEFTLRCITAFNEITEKYNDKTVAFIVHGGTIMTIMSHIFGGDFYDYQVKNLEGYVVDTDKMRYDKITVTEC